MRRPLSPYERAMLRRIARQLREQDPELAQQLERPGIPAIMRLSPWRWSSSVYLVIGVAFLTAGVLLDVGSAILGGLFSICASILRSPSAHRVASMVFSAREGGFKRPLG
jgi:hypothetical protein